MSAAQSAGASGRNPSTAQSAPHGPLNLGLRSLVVTLALSSGAMAQNAFRPLPALPDTVEWPGRAAVNKVSPAALWFDQLEADAQQPRERTFVDVRALADVALGADFQGGGSLTSQRGGWEAVIGTELDGERLAAFSVRTEAFFYNFGGANGLVPGESEPFNDLYRASFAGVVRSKSSTGPGWFAGFQVALGGEDEAEARDALIVGGAGGVRYRANDELEVELGLAALSRLEDDTWIWPYVGFRWQAADWLEFAAQGTQLEARAFLDEHWSVFGRAQYALQQFRLNDDNPLPAGVVRDEEIRAGVGIERREARGLSIELLAGLNLWRELSTLDRGGQLIAEDELEAAPFVALTLNLSF